VTALDRVTTLGEAATRDHRPSLTAALDWLVHAQDVAESGLLRAQGARPDTPGLVVPTLYLAACYLERPDLAGRAERAAQWAVEAQLSSGAVLGGVVATGRSLLGWLSAFAETGSGVFAGAARRAGRFLFATLDHDGVWRRDGAHSPHTAWALAEAGRRLGVPEFRAAAARHLRAVMRDYAWPEGSGRPCVAADAIRGMLEGGRLLGEQSLIAHAALAAAGWRPSGSGGCLVGQARMVNVWLRLFEITGARQWLEPVRPALGLLASTQRRDGAIAGPARECGTATKLFVDALIRDERTVRGLAGETTAAAAVLA
jgi:hypothetical protein